jgi:hypothetical protein
MAKMDPQDRTWAVIIDGIGGVEKTSLVLLSGPRRVLLVLDNMETGRADRDA